MIQVTNTFLLKDNNKWHNHINVHLLCLFIAVGPEVPSDPLQFSLISTRDAVPPIFTLSFNVTHRPPTDVICTKDDSLIIKIDKHKDLSREIIQSTTPIIVRVTVTLRERGPGVYTCNVSNARVDNKKVYPGTTPSKRVTGNDINTPLIVITYIYYLYSRWHSCESDSC